MFVFSLAADNFITVEIIYCHAYYIENLNVSCLSELRLIGTAE